ncbi:MAG: exonuclease [Bacteroidales bacterium]|nr:exonuclease [Bacteroidales bacterium]
MNIPDFVAIDFELFTPEYTSACAIGIVRVINRNITQKFYSLINPIPDNREFNNSVVHGITADMLVDAPTFKELFPVLRDFIGDLPIVCHQRSTDINIFDRCMEYYGLSGIDTNNNFCTYSLTEKSLSDCCKQFNIEQGCHHDALDDATACAKVFIAIQGSVIAETFKGGLKAVFASRSDRKYERATLDQLSDDKVENKATPFFHASVVITGTFNAYPNRNDLGKLIQSLGADINTAISGKTTIVVVGQGAGPAKIKKIEDLRAKGNDIRIIYEPELIEILGK